MTDHEWNVIRTAADWVIQDLDGEIELPEPDSPITSIQELAIYLAEHKFRMDLLILVGITSEALRRVADEMVEIHRIANLTTNRPGRNQIEELMSDLRAVSIELQTNDQFKAGVEFAGTVADVIESIQGI